MHTSVPHAPAPHLTGTAAQLMELSQLVAGAGAGTPSREDLTATALALVVDTVPGARWASLTHRGKALRTTAANDPYAEKLDRVQYRTGTGPCLTALDTGTVVVSDFTTETRWPDFTAQVTGAAQGALSYPLAPGGRPATSLNLYTDVRGAFDGLTLHTAAVAAAGLAFALTAIDQRHRADQLESGLATSRRIGAAVGILMHRHRWTYEQAFTSLTRTSQHTNRKLRDVAEDVVLTGDLPTR
jgi:hypothetical protein